MAKPQRTETLAPQADAEPLASATHDEHRGLAARLLDLRKVVEDYRLLAVKEHAQTVQKMAQIEQQLSSIEKRVDKEVESIQLKQRELDQHLRDGAEQVRKAGELGRKMTDQVQELAELREMAADPHEVIKPVRASIAQVRADVEALAKTIDVRFEQLPKAKGQAYESRGDDEAPLAKLGTEIRKLKERLSALESD